MNINVINSGLTFRTKDQVRLSVRAVSVLPDNSRIEVEVGDPDGDRRTYIFMASRIRASLSV